METPTLLLILTLVLIYILAFAVRLFSVLRFESVIHEFDPYFNYRTTKFLVDNGIYEFYNWFDPMVWYPLGRIVGGTIYPGLMLTSAATYWTLHSLSFTLELRNVCVFLAAWFASNTAVVTYFFGKEVRDRKTGLVAAALIAIVPGYISRSVAGSYDNEGVAIFALILTFYYFVKAVNTGSMFWCFWAVLAYYYMVNAWGGYIFIINLLPVYVLTLLVMGRYTHRLYVAYCTFYVLGTLLCMQVHFVGFQAVQSGEHMAAAAVFFILQAHNAVLFVRDHLEPSSFKRFLRIGLVGMLLLAGVAVMLGILTGYISPWTGRFWTLLDPTYAKLHIPIIASVSEHQPTCWSSFFFDLHCLVFLFPVGMFFCFQKLTDAAVFAVIYGMTSVYFAGVMVRLMLVLAPAMCVMAAIALSTLLTTFFKDLKRRPKGAKAPVEATPLRFYTSAAVVAGLVFLLWFYVIHCTWVTAEAYSSPSIVLNAHGSDGHTILFDDYREAYYWIRKNTPADAKIMSWWDYGYQITAMGNRTVLVDNNTWNNTHIATVGKAMASDEETAYRIMRQLDVDYVLVIFGGLIGYSSDDINKFLWMVRIGGTLDPSIREVDYYSQRNEYRIDNEASKTMLNSMMYKLCYYRYGDVQLEHGKPPGFDRVRGAEIGKKDVRLERVEEAYTTEHWMIRIYKVKPEDNR